MANSLPAINDITAAELKSVSLACFSQCCCCALACHALPCGAACCALSAHCCAALLADPPSLPCHGRRLLPRRQRCAPSSGQLEMQQWRQRRPTMGACRLCQVGGSCCGLLDVLRPYWETRNMPAPCYTQPFAPPLPGCPLLSLCLCRLCPPAAHTQLRHAFQHG